MLFDCSRRHKTETKEKKRTSEMGEEKEEVLGSKNIPETAGAWSFSPFSVAGIVRTAQYGSYDFFDRWNRGVDFSAILAISAIILEPGFKDPRAPSYKHTHAMATQ